MGEYKDSFGVPCSLGTLCRQEPEWAVSRIERLTAEVTNLRGLVRAVASETSTPMEEIEQSIATASGRQTSEFSRFIREGTPEEKEEVFERVIGESNKAQQALVDSDELVKR